MPFPRKTKPGRKAFTKSNKLKKLEECAWKNWPERAGFIMEAFGTKGDERRHVAVWAATNRSDGVLKAIFKKGRFDFSRIDIFNMVPIFQLFNAARSGPLPTWDLLCQLNKSTKNGQLSTIAVTEIAAGNDMGAEILDFYLHKAPPDEMNAFKSFLKLNDSLLSAVTKGNIKKVSLLLEVGADPNNQNGATLVAALSKENKELVDLLLPLTNMDTARLSVDDQKILARLTGKEPEAAAVTPDKEDMILVDKNTIADVQNLPGDMKLTTLFNFKTCQQVLILEKNGVGASPTIASNSFDDLSDQDVIDAMHAKLIELGGTAENPRRLQKETLPKVTLPKA